MNMQELLYSNVNFRFLWILESFYYIYIDNNPKCIKMKNESSRVKTFLE